MSSTGRGALSGLAWAVCAVALATPAHAEPARWSAGEALGVPAWLRVSLDHQARAEHLADDFRATATGDASAISLRTLVKAEARGPSLFAVIELEDARTFATESTPLNTTLTDPLELLQAHAGFSRGDLLCAGDRLEARAGRITIDLGSRRLVARNRFRTTINGFTGLDATWTGAGKHVARVLAAVPVTREPADAEGLRDQSIDLDEENLDALLWGAAYGSPALAAATQLEAFVVGFHERDGETATRNRQLITASLRWFRKPAPRRLDFEVELLPQLGTSRATSAAADVTGLDHRALSTHAEVGLSPDAPGKPRVALLHDLATGDRDPADRVMSRFDPLFGARRFDFGPTGIYGPINRSNVQSPGLRVTVAPAPRLDATMTYRLFWLAAAADAWSLAGVSDPSGAAGRHLGQQVEAQVRWTVRPSAVIVEGGGAYLRRGRFARTAPGGREEPPAYLYLQLNLSI
jgi:hypothetical protein